MNDVSSSPTAKGQLVWSPADPSLGTGVVTAIDETRVWVRFARLREKRAYTRRGAEQVIVRYEIRRGERVRDREGAEHRVERALRATEEGLVVYLLEGGAEVIESELLPEVRVLGAKEQLGTLNLVHPEVVRARAQGMSLARFADRAGIAAILGARAMWLPHQIDVATRAITSDRARLLLADEVGLGKTVEATLIYAGLRAEGRADRVLILTPDSLCIQWLGEIYRKAHELLVLLDEERIEDAIRDCPELSPFEAHQRVVASIDRIARDPTLAEQVAAASWDLVIVDEAHHLHWRPKDGGNAAYRLVESLAQKTQHLLLLTATPMALDPAEYHALLRLLDPLRFDDPSDFAVVTERAAKIRELGRKLAHNEELAPADVEAIAALLKDDTEDSAMLERFLTTSANAPARKAQERHLLSALRERHGLADYVVRNRRGPVGGLPERRAIVAALDPTPMQEALIEAGEGVMVELAATLPKGPERSRSIGELLRALWATPRALTDILAPLSSELTQLLTPYIDRVVEAPLDATGLPTGDARLRWLCDLLRGTGRGEKVLVFVESAIAVRALRAGLDPILGADIAVFHRGLAPRDQDRQVAWFRDPQGPRVMLSTEAGGEGRNFQFCHKVVLYDLPWRPATIEQRIGRIDRVGQTEDVSVLVPYYRSGYEAAILKVMQDSIGVLKNTVGGIDYALEHISCKIADLILEGGGAEDWKQLYRNTQKLVEEARARVSQEADPILDHASYSPERVAALLKKVPHDLEVRVESFIHGYAEHSRLQLKSKGGPLLDVEGAPSAAGREDSDGSYVATLSRTYALDHEDVEFLSFGHPLVMQAEEWARESHEECAALALCRGFARDGAVFLWRFELDLPPDVPEALAFFENCPLTFALDEQGARVPALEDLLEDAERPLDRMDPSPLRASQARWRRLVDSSYTAADALAMEVVREVALGAEQRVREIFARRERVLARTKARELASRSKARKAIRDRHESDHEALIAARERLLQAVTKARPSLTVAMAVRMLRARDVSA